MQPTSPPPIPPGGTSKLRLSRHNKIFGGVCGGVAEWWGWNPWLIRVMWVIATPTSMFAGLVIYIVLWDTLRHRTD